MNIGEKSKDGTFIVTAILPSGRIVVKRIADGVTWTLGLKKVQSWFA